ncbi:hypothetical protein [Streptomyces griseorubiginosus]|uniref:hypothetical protein n=1 Tax=Streptomyces griseorubiginosus TaxID=67304 RepID=UPI002E823EE3|nr:hypothetical protein [Streptomyces griseorubiginosus]WUB58822.1 hypothetical protein OG942_44090 [Streptomyces griseorubiginosus]
MNDDFNARAIPAFPRQNSGVRLVDLATGEEIKPGQTIPEPNGHGHVTYVGPTVATQVSGTEPVPGGRVAVVRYTTPATNWAFRPAELNARYVDADASHGEGDDGQLPPQPRRSE